MDQILIYGDSLSWGIIPGTRKRLAFADRWPGVMHHELFHRGNDVLVIEDCLNGRRTACEDPNKPGRNGLTGLEQRIEVNSPLALVMIFLGTNDFQSVHQLSASDSASGIGRLVAAVRRAPIVPGMPNPRILLIAPPRIDSPMGEMASKFAGAESKCEGIGDAIGQVANDTECEFFDSASVATTSPVDGVHLDKSEHARLGRALAVKVHSILDGDATQQLSNNRPVSSALLETDASQDGIESPYFRSVTAETASKIESIVDAWEPRLLEISPPVAHQKPSDDRWAVAEVIGHLVDSACNNHQRFVRAQGAGELTFPKYDQNQWVFVAGYRQCNWGTLVTLWRSYNTLLAQLIRQIPDSELDTPCTITPYETCSLRFLVTDYLTHLQHHLRILCERLSVDAPETHR